MKGGVEMCHSNRWGIVCDDSWDYKDAVVVCNWCATSWATRPKKKKKHILSKTVMICKSL